MPHFIASPPRFVRLILALAFMIPAINAATLTPAVAARSYTLSLPQGTPVSLRAVQDVLSNRVRAGGTVALTVTQDVRFKNVIFVRAGAPAHGTVVYSRGSGVGFPGEMMVAVLDMQAKDGTWIPLRTQPQPGNGLARVIPDNLYDYASAHFPSGKNQRLSYQRVFHTWTDETRTFVVTPSGSHNKIALAWPAKQPGKRLVKLPDGVAIQLNPARDISSGQVSTGDSLDFVTIAPTVVNGVTVIAQGAPVKGTVLLSRHSEMANKGGLLVISIDKVRAVDGSWVSLAASQAGRGSGNKVLGTAASALLVPGIGLAIPGRESVVHQNKEIDTFVFGNRYIAVPLK